MADSTPAASQAEAMKGMFDGFPMEGEPLGEAAPAPTESSPEKTDAKETPPVTEDKPELEAKAEVPQDEKPLPFHEHPRWKKQIEEKRQLEDTVKGLNDRLSQFEKERSEAEARQIPQEWIDLYGDNPESWEKFRQLNQKLNAREVKPEVKEAPKYDASWVEGQLQELTDEGLKYERNELLTVMKEYMPTDSQGNIDFRKGVALLGRFKEVEKLKSTDHAKARKEVAASVTSSKSGDKTVQPLTPEQLRKLDWRDAARYGT